MIFDSPCTKNGWTTSRFAKLSSGTPERLTRTDRVSFHRNEARHVPCAFSDNRLDVTRERVRENVATVVDLAVNSIGRPRERGETERATEESREGTKKKRDTKRIQRRTRDIKFPRDHVGRQSQ